MPLQYAALPQRGAAFLIDALTLSPLAFTPWPWHAVGVAVWLAAFEASPWQATIGKRLLRCKVMESQGRKVTLGRAVARAVVKSVPVALVQPYPYAAATVAALSLVAIVVDRRCRALHDLAAGTAVIRPPKDYRG